MSKLSPIWVLAQQTFQTVIGRRRFAFVLVLALLPILFVAVGHVLRGAFGLEVMTPRGIFTTLASMYFPWSSMLMNLVIGLALVSDEVEGHTLPYLTVRPFPRSWIIYGKYLALVGLGLVVLPSSLVASYVLAFATEGLAVLSDNLGVLWKELSWVALSVPAYGAAFTLIGAIAWRPINLSVGFVMVWEIAFTFVPTALRHLTITHNLLSMSPQAHKLMTLTDLLGMRSSLWLAALSLAGLSAAYLAAAGLVFSHRQYVLADTER